MGEFRDKGSKFIGFAYAVTNEEEAKNVIKQLKKDHPQANHHCWALVLGADKSFQKSSDDREPNNTAGKPILRAILQKNITQVLVVVVRYFGGKLLGVPGLINAYQGAATNALHNVSIIEKQVIEVYNVEADFDLHNTLYKTCKMFTLKISQTDNINANLFTFEVRKSKANAVIQYLQEAGITKIKYIQTI